MRYPDEGGLTAEQRKRREEVCMRAADLFEEDVKVPCVTRTGEREVGRPVARLGVRRAGGAALPGARPAGSVWGAARCGQSGIVAGRLLRGEAGRVQASGRAGCLLPSAAVLAVGHCASQSIPVTRRMR